MDLRPHDLAEWEVGQTVDVFAQRLGVLQGDLRPFVLRVRLDIPLPIIPLPKSFRP